MIITYAALSKEVLLHTSLQATYRLCCRHTDFLVDNGKTEPFKFDKIVHSLSSKF